MLENSWKIRDMAMENSDGRMAENMKDSGIKGNSMALVSTEMLKEKKGEVNGKMAKEQTGLTDYRQFSRNFNIAYFLMHY
jgi:hypothetical protein